MAQESINYIDVMALGFSEQIEDDEVYFEEHGFDYVIIQKKLTSLIYLDWDKATRLCDLIRIDTSSAVLGRMPVRNLDAAIDLIKFFTNKEE